MAELRRRHFTARRRFTPDNGQVWRNKDQVRGFYGLDNLPVRIERAPLCGFLMTIEGGEQRPRVRRIR